MNEQAGVQIIWYAFFTAGGLIKTGLTPSISVYKDTTAQPEVADPMTELASGFYYYVQTPADEGFRVAMAQTSDVTVDQRHVPAIMCIGKAGVENLDAPISGIGTAGGAAVNAKCATDNYSAGIPGVTEGTTRVGTQTGTYEDTYFEGGDAHVMTHEGQVVDIVYQFLIGGGTTVVRTTWVGNISPNNDVLTMEMWNHVDGVWEEIGTVAGQSSATVMITKSIDVFPHNAGTSPEELGKVYLRLHSSAAYDHILRTDRVFDSHSVTARTVGYADGAIWVRADGVAGTEAFVNGTADNPCPWADAQTIATALGLSSFRIVNGETVTLTADTKEKCISGDNWTLALGGQDISDSHFEGARISGIAVAGATTPPIFTRCSIDGTTMPGCKMYECGMGRADGVFTAAAGTDDQYIFVDCYSLVPGAGTPVFDFSGGTTARGINFRRWSGGSDITLDGICSLSFDIVAGGEQTIAVGGADVEIRGICREIAMTGITSDSLVQINCVTGPISLTGTGTPTVNISGVSGVVTATGIAVTLNTAVSLTNNIALETTLTAIKGATFDTTDSLEAIRNRGDAAWTTATDLEITPEQITEIAEGVAGEIDLSNLDAAVSTRVTPDQLAAALAPFVPAFPTPEPPLTIGYCSRAHIENVFGAANVRTWADLDNDGDTAKIDARITWVISVVQEDIDSRFRRSLYTLPLQTADANVPWVIIGIAANLAGVMLYESRGITDFNPETGAAVHKLGWNKKQAEDTIQAILVNSRQLDALARVTSSTPGPEVIT